MLNVTERKQALKNNDILRDAVKKELSSKNRTSYFCLYERYKSSDFPKEAVVRFLADFFWLQMYANPSIERLFVGEDYITSDCDWAMCLQKEIGVSATAMYVNDYNNRSYFLKNSHHEFTGCLKHGYSNWNALLF